MTQSTRSNLLGRASPTVNTRYQNDIDAVAAHDKAISDQANPDATIETQVEPNHNWEKRYKDLQRHSSRQSNEMQGKLDAMSKQGVQPLNVPKTAEEMQALKQADPEGYARIEAIASSMVDSKMSAYDTQLATMNNDLTETRIAKAELEIKKVHPDFDAIVANDKFHDWAETQSKEIQDWVYNNPDQPQKAIAAISLYKFEAGQGSQHTQSNQQPTPAQTEGADLDVNIKASSHTSDNVDRNHPTYVWTETEIGKMRPEEFGKWEQHISLAQREGRVAYGN